MPKSYSVTFRDGPGSTASDAIQSGSTCSVTTSYSATTATE
ncbi:hypothetical protein [Subtercola sp. PAMC28395]|nr:hypothetical protein [Subtercola sp. PAMC28395]